MKNIIKRTLAILLAVVMTVGSAPLSGFVELELPDWLDFENSFEIKADAASDIYEINYYVDGELQHTDKYEAGAAVTAWSYIPLEGLTFSGWGDQVPATMPTNNVDVYGTTGVLSYTVTFTINGEEYATCSFAYGSMIVPPEYTPPEGYEFSGWDCPATMPAHDITIDASLISYNIEFEIVFLDDEGIRIDSFITCYGDKIDLDDLGVPEKDGYEFKCWTVNGERVSFPYAVTSNVIFTASFSVVSYDVIWVVDGKVVYTDSYDFGDAIVMRPDEVKEGYTFSGWNKNLIGDTMPAEDIQINGSFTINKYDAFFYADDTLVATIPTQLGEMPIPPKAPTKTGYEFISWSPSIVPMTVAPEGIRYNAVYSSNVAEYKLEIYKMDTDGVYSKPEVLSFFAESGAEVNYNPANIEGFTVDTNKSILSNKISEDGSTVFKVYYVRNKHVFKISADGILTITEYYYGANIVAITPPKIEGKIFAGWLDNKGEIFIFPQAMPDYDCFIEVSSTWIDEIITSGTCGENLTWVYDEPTCTLTISGTGGINHLYYDESLISLYPIIQRVNIKNGITSIDDLAFYGWVNLKRIIIPDGVTRIDDFAFGGCANLENITIPDSVTSIGDSAFARCTSLVNITIPNGVESIGDHIFNGCTKLENVTISNGITIVGDRMFYGCVNLKDITIPNSVTSIGDSAFAGCTSLAFITVPEQVTRIGNYSFKGCTGLKCITIPEGVTSIGSYAFEGCSCTAFTSITIPESVTDIGNAAFKDCASLKNITILSNVTSVDDYTFSGCKSLVSISIPNSVSNIGEYAFNGCASLKNITIPNGVISIGDYAFNSCKSISSISIPCDLPKHVFANCIELETVNLNDNITIIGDYAFEGCVSLENIIIPDSVISINEAVFMGCAGLNYITIPDGVTSIGDYAFKGCTGLKRITIPDGVTSIGAFAFSECVDIASITIGEKVTSIGNGAFEGCTSLKNVIIPDNVTRVGGSVFRNCTSLISATIGNGLYNIESFMFGGCTSLVSVIIGYKVCCISSHAFFECDNFTDIFYVGTEDQWREIELEDIKYEYNAYLKNANVHYNYVGSHTHIYRETIIEPTCTRQGYTTHTCNECGYTYVNNYVEKYGHKNLTHYVVESTCTVQGSEYDICEFCKSTLNRITLPLLEHKFTHNTIESTCSTYGYEEDYCSECKKTYNHIKLPLKSHDLEHITVDSTCTVEGYEYDICSVCENEFDYANIPRKPHNFEHIMVDSTCTAKGFEYDICSVCKNKFEYVEIPMKAHTLEHIIVDSTCTAEGCEYNKCSVCKNEFDKTIIPLKQHYCSETVINPTCTEQGYTLWECKNCVYSYNDSYNDALGHDFSEWNEMVVATCITDGEEQRACSRCEHKETQTIKAYGHNWSEWTVDKHATVLAEGVMSKTCSACEDKEEQLIDKVQIDLETNKCYGLASFTVVNAQTKEPIEGASIFISTEKDGENTFVTDADGKVSVILPVGKQIISAYAENCLTRNLNVTVSSGENNIPVIGLSDKETYKVKLTSKEMTYEEILDAGIDTTNPSNNHVFKYELKLEFEPEIDWASLFFYMNVDGDIIGSRSPSNNNTGNGGDGTGRSWTWIPPEDNRKGHFVIEPKEKGEDKIVVYPVSEYMYLIIRGEITWLKEMFDVEMLVINNSQTDTLENLTCTLELPDGLSLAAMVEEPQSLIQIIDHVAEGESKSVHWYVRGNEEGSYDLKAKLEGTIMPFEEEINEEFVTENAIQVWAGSALNLHIEIPDAAYYGIDYPVRITLTNVSDRSLYNVCHLIRNIEQSKVVHYSNGKIVNETYMDEDFVGHEFVKELKPGDKIVMEISVNILFESELIEYELQKIVGLIDGIEGLLEAYKGIKAAFDALSALDKCISGCEKALNKFLKSTSYLSEAKLDLARDLYKSISKLLRKYTSSGNKALDCAARIGDSTIILILDAFASDPETFLEEHSYDDIKALIKDVEALGNLFDSDDEKALKKFDIFDAIRTAIESLPVVFALKNVVLSEYASNTTSIPWSYSTVDTGAQYFGVSNVSSYYGNLMKAIMAEVWNEAAPSYLKLIPGLDDPLNYNDVKREIIAVENEIAEFKAKDATGEITFKAWVERNETTATFSSKTIQIETFELSCDNATSVFENGVLTFTGDGTISVVPTSTNGGVLVIEDSEGNRYEYSITVVEQHNCVAGENEIIINPTSKYDGFAVKRCTVCKDVVDIEILSVFGCVEHSFSEWEIECEATCSASGMKSHECLLCGFCEIDYSESVMHNPGEWTTITATEAEAEKQVRYCTVCGEIAEEKYSDYIAVESVSVNLSVIELVNGQRGNLSATVLPHNASNRSVEWRSSDRNVVVVSNDGTIIAVSPGAATITVTTEDGNFNSSCEVTVLPREFNVTWIVDDVETVKTESECAIITKPDDPEKAGYTFTGWSPEIPQSMPAEELTFTAMFEANSYDAVFDANGGAWADGATEKTISVKFDDVITAPEAPKKQGYVFSRWTPEIGVMDSTDGKTFTAEWIPATDTRYTVETYTMNTEGEYETSSQVFSGTTDSTVSVEAEEKTGFTFNSEKSVMEGSVKADNSLVLKVYYDRNKYAFTTVTDGVSSTENYYYGATIVTPASPEKQGYKFIKWEGEIPETMPAEAITITAVFEKSYTCPDCGKEILGEAAINEHIAAESRMKATVEIKNNNGSNTIKYGETLRLTAITTDMPADVIVCWYVNGEKKGEGETFELSFESGTKTVEVKLVDAKGNVLKNASGNEIKDTETVTVKAGFFQKLIAFFKKLFGISQTVVQSIYF